MSSVRNFVDIEIVAIEKFSQHLRHDEEFVSASIDSDNGWQQICYIRRKKLKKYNK